MHLRLSNLILACRNSEKGEAAKRSILESNTGKKSVSISVWEVDLDHFDSVIAFNKRVQTQLPRLDGFVANAGIELEKFELSEGCERSLTINVLSTFLMAFGVLPKLNETATNFGTPTALSLVGSMVHIFGPDSQLLPNKKGDTFSALSDPKSSMAMRYPLSKLIEHLCFLELAARTRDTPVTINVVNPGWCLTELSRYRGEPFIQKVMALIFRRTSEAGGKTLVHAVTAGPDTHGKYLSECQVKPMSVYVRSAAGVEAQKRLYSELVKRLEKLSPDIIEKYNQ